jgi:eukaryotic-like serine/threonine-protein kinase
MYGRGRVTSLNDRTGIGLLLNLEPSNLASIDYEENTPSSWTPARGYPSTGASSTGPRAVVPRPAPLANVRLDMEWDQEETPTQIFSPRQMLPDLPQPVASPTRSAPRRMPAKAIPSARTTQPLPAAIRDAALLARPAARNMPQASRSLPAMHEVSPRSSTARQSASPRSTAALQASASPSRTILPPAASQTARVRKSAGPPVDPAPAPQAHTFTPPALERQQREHAFAPPPQVQREPRARIHSLQPFERLPDADDIHGLRPTRGAWFWRVAAGLGLVVIGLTARYLFSGPATSTVSFETTPADAETSIDGRALLGNSPYTRDGLRAGNHVLVVHKAGFVDYRATFDVRAGEPTHLSAVRLDRPVAPPAPAPDTGFTINSQPAGAEVRVDGSPAGQVTPARVIGLRPGTHAIQLELDGYQTAEQSLAVAQGMVAAAADVVLKPQYSKRESVARAERSAARAEIVRERWLARHPPRHPKDDSALARSEPAVAAPSRPVRQPRAAAAATPDTSDSQPAASAVGMLQINSRPWSQVYVDGKLVGNTPQFGLALRAGKHSVKLVNTTMELSKTLSVVIQAGQTLTKVENLGE